MDMCRKSLQMGYTDSRRYANKSGKNMKVGSPWKWKEEVDHMEDNFYQPDPDAVKAESAAIFYEVWQRVRNDQLYAQMPHEHKNKRK